MSYDMPLHTINDKMTKCSNVAFKTMKAEELFTTEKIIPVQR